MTSQILVVTNAAVDAGILKAALGSARDGPFGVQSVTHIAAALERLRDGRIDAILVDLSLPDTLTDLPNRALLSDRIEHAIAVAKRNCTKLAVLFIDLDNFKNINDSLGHAVGDKVLKVVTKRLTSSVRSSDTVGRLGGDEFVILLAEATEMQNLVLTANKILVEMALPHTVENRELLVTASIGISVYPEDGKEVDTLIQSADKAMYRAKKLGRNNYQFLHKIQINSA